MPSAFPLRAQDFLPRSQAISFTDRRGLELGTILSRDQNQTMAVELDAVSPYFLDAILAAEDDDFFAHGPLDLMAIVRAIQQKLETGKVQSGASTITLQLARMKGDRPRTLPSKLAEVWTAWRIRAGMTHREILTAYVNRLPMGGNIYGVEAGARTYFGIPAKNLSLSQATVLAALPNNPNGFNPYHHPRAYKPRQAHILQRLVHLKRISPDQAQRASQETITLQPRNQSILAAPHFLFWLARQWPDQPQIQTSLDRSLQTMVETQVRSVVTGLKSQRVSQGAALVLDNATGEVLAYVGSQDYFDPTHFGSNDGVQALRQPGSTLKPFLYQLALEKQRLDPTTILADIPTHYALPAAKVYSPSDYSGTFAGPVRVRVALANSLNVPAVRVLEKVGVPVFLARLQQLGFTDLRGSPEDYGLGLTLGSGEVSLWQLAQAYRTMAQGGQKTPLVTSLPSSISTNLEQIGDPDTWSIITDMLGDRHARARSFGVDSVLNLPFPVAVKTGTSSDYRDTWTVGFSRKYTVATWVGNFDGSPMQAVSGVTGSAPLWQRIFRKLHETDTPLDFDPPQGYSKHPICALSGLKPTPACPTVVQEYIQQTKLAEYHNKLDSLYQTLNGQTRLNLPAHYNTWLAQQPEPPLSTSLKILFPQDGDRFLMPKDGKAPKLALTITGLSGSATWRINGKIIYQGSENHFFWTLEPGDWTLSVETRKIDEKITFKVIQSSAATKERGFSVMPTP